MCHAVVSPNPDSGTNACAGEVDPRLRTHINQCIDRARFDVAKLTTELVIADPDAIYRPAVTTRTIISQQKLNREVAAQKRFLRFPARFSQPVPFANGLPFRPAVR